MRTPRPVSRALHVGRAVSALGVIVALSMAGLSAPAFGDPTPTPTPSTTSTPTPSSTASATPTPTPVPTPSSTPMAVPPTAATDSGTDTGTGSISGTVDLQFSTSSGPADDTIQVWLYATDDLNNRVDVVSVEEGAYQFNNVAPGTYYVEFAPRNDLEYPTGFTTAWYGGSLFEDDSTPVVVAAEATVTDIDATLQYGSTISGSITTEAMDPPYGYTSNVLDVFAYLKDPATGKYVVIAGAQENTSVGTYQIVGLPAGSYLVSFFDPTEGTTGLTTWWDHEATQATAKPIVVTQFSAATGINGDVPQGPRNTITGYVTTDSGAPLDGIQVQADQIDPDTGESRQSFQTTTNNTGFYGFYGLPDGNYQIAFYPVGTAYLPQAYNDESIYYYPDLVPAFGGGLVSPISAKLHLAGTISGTVSVPRGTTADFVAGDVTAEVEVLDVPTNTWTETGDVYPVVSSGSGGQYTIPSLPPDNYRILIDYSGSTFTGHVLSPVLHVAAGSSVTYNASLVPVAAGSFDTATGVIGGIQLSGWSLDTSTPSSSYVWVNVDGLGGPLLANGSLPWIDVLYPGEGAEHGFSETLSASPGKHTVCVYGTNSLALGCKSVTVPQNAQGSFDSAIGVPGGVQLSGWSLDLSTTASTYVWVNVDGTGGPMLSNVSLPWINSLFPGEGVNHGFAGTLPAMPGTHTVCVYGTNSLPLGCKTVTVPQNAQGSFDSASGVIGGIQISGWSLDLSQTASTYLWVNVDGTGGPMLANVSLPWINSLFPGEGANHGFAGTLAASPGKHTVCVYGTNSISLGCKTVSVPQNAAGSFDTAAGVVGGIQISGWSLDLSTTVSTYIWVNVDGSGGPMLANVSLPWINALFPGEGTNHGFAGEVVASPGKHNVCVYGTNSLALGCKTVTVPTS